MSDDYEYKGFEWKGFEWKGETVRTLGEIGGALCRLETPEEAAAFFAAYQTTLTDPAHAGPNIGYLMGYYGAEQRRRVYGLFDRADIGVAHPVFGGAFGRG